MKWLRRLSVFHTLALLVSLALFGLASNASAYETKSSKANRVQVDVKPVQLRASSQRRSGVPTPGGKS
jgi:hypothetical protein